MPALQNFKVQAKAETITHATLNLYGVVGGDGFFEEGFRAKDVVDALAQLPNTIKTLDLHINSPGGSVFEGMAIYNRIKQYGNKVKITAHIDALSASIASVIMLAASEIKMSDTGFVMIHKPWGYAIGNSDDLEKVISLLDDIENQMLNLYSSKTKLSRMEIKTMLTKETWMDSKQAKELGFIDTEVKQEIPVAACAGKDWLKSAPKNLVTEETLAKQKALNLSNKVKDFLARSKK